MKKVQRWVDLLAALLAHQMPLTFEQIAREVPGYAGKSKATQKRMFERDKLELRAFGVPIQSMGEEGSDDSAYRLAPKDFYLPYLSVATPRGLRTPRRIDKYGYRALTSLDLETDELLAIADAAARVRLLHDAALAADIDAATRKLAFDAAVDGPSDDVAVLVRQPPDAKTLATIAEAVHARKRLRFDYAAMDSPEQTKREVEPYGLFFLSGNWYVAGFDASREGLRNFRVNRMRAVKANRARSGTPDFDVPSTFRLREHAASRQAWELGDSDLLHAVVEFGESGSAQAALRLGERVPGKPNQRRFRVRRLDAFVRWLMSFAGDATPIEPPDVVAALERQAAETLALYGGSR
jgi:predicted DNA-binding transcriptional regulator YafY